MPIVFACACGKQLKTVEENAGKRVKCPACGQPVPVPAAKPAAASAPPPKAEAKAPAGDVLRFACACGKQLQARLEMAGKRVKCPACGNELAVPGPNGAPAKPAAKKPDLAAATTPKAPKPKIHEPPPDPAEDEGDFDQLPAVTKKKPVKKSSALPLLIGLAAAFLVLASGLFAGYWFFLRPDDSIQPIRPGPVPVAQTDKEKEPKPIPNPKPPDPQPAEPAPDLDLVPRDVVGFATVRVSSLWDSPAGKKLRQEVFKDQLPMLEAVEKEMGLGVADVERITFVVLSPNLDANEGYLIAKTTRPLDKTKMLAILVPGSVEKEVKGKTIYVAPPNQDPKDKGPVPAVYFVNDHILVAGDPPILEKFLDKPAKPDAAGPLSEALKLAAGKRHLVAGVNPPAAALQQAREGLPPDAAPAFAPLLELTGGTILADLGDDLLLEASVAYPDDAKAAKAQQAAGGALTLGRIGLGAFKKDPALAELFKAIAPLEKALDTIKIEPKGPTVQLTLKTEGGALPGLVSNLARAFLNQGGPAGPQASANNLKQIALAMHNHQDALGRLPDSSKDKDGKPLLSWRVHVLPYIGEEALYKQFKLDEPWDSSHNMNLVAKMPKAFEMPDRPASGGATYFQVLTNAPGIPFDPKMCAPFGGPQPPRFPQNFPDGVSNTLLVVEAGQAVPWTKPADVAYDPTGPLPKFGDPTKPTWLAEMGDGSVKAVKRTVTEPTLRNAICPADGMPLGKDWNE